MLIVEEGAIGGFATQVIDFLARNDLCSGLRIRPLMLPDQFIDHDTPAAMYGRAGLDAEHIVVTALAAMGKDELPAKSRA